MEILLIILSFTLTFIMIKLSIPIFKINLQAKPTSRGMHYFPKPTGGGIWFSSIISFLSLLNGFYLPLFSLPLSIISLVDDKYNLKRSIRYISQVLFVLFIYLYLSFKNQLFINNYSNNDNST